MADTPDPAAGSTSRPTSAGDALASPTTAAEPQTIVPSAAPLRALWLAMPSVQRYAEDFQEEAPCLEADVTALMCCAFRSARTNCDLADAEAAVAELQGSLPAIPPLASEPPPLLTGGGEDGTAPEVGTIARGHFDKIVVEHVLPAWLPPGDALIALRPSAAPASPEKPAAASKEGDADSPASTKKKSKKGDKEKEAAEKAAAEAAAKEAAALAAIPKEELARAAQLDALVDAVVDDREPRALLPFDAVITMPLAKAMPVKLGAFTRTVAHPQHAACYDAMWEALGKESTAAAGSAVPVTTSAAEYARWFAHWASWAAPNMTLARAAIAARTHWLDATAAAGTMGFDEFLSSAEALCALYTRGAESPVAFFTEYVAAVRAAQAEAGTDVLFYAVAPTPRYAADASKGIVLESALDLFTRDDLDEPAFEKAVSKLPSANRILVTGLEACGKKTLARALAARVNAQLVDVFDLALEAIDAATPPPAPAMVAAEEGDDAAAAAAGDDDNADAPASSPADEAAKAAAAEAAEAALQASLDVLGLEIKKALDDEKPISLDLQARLVQRCLRRSRTLHRGFVFGDLPPVTESTTQAIDNFVNTCGLHEWPTATVNVRMPSELYASWRNTVRGAKLQHYEEELALRQAEADAVTAAETAAREKAEKKAARQAIVDRQARIDAGEIEATEEDKAFMEAGGVDSLEPEEEEPEPIEQLDEDGNPLEPEQIAAREAAAAAAVVRRKLVAELKRQLLAGRYVAADEAQVEAATLPSLKPIVSQCAARDRHVELASFDDPAACVDFLFERLSMAPSVVPALPAVPADQLEGIEAGPDGDAQLADIHKAVLQEAGMALSPWDSVCPVTRKEDGVFVQGSWAFACHFRGFMYCFASQAKLERFLDAPLPYLLQSPNDAQPVLLLAKTRSTLKDAGIDAAVIEAKLAESLGVTAGDLAEYAATWKAYDDEVARRAALEAARRAADAKALKAREDRARAAKEGDGKKKKTDKKKKKADKDGDADADAADAEAAKAATPEEVKEPPVLTTEERIQADIDAAVVRKAKTVPHLVSCLGDLSRDTVTDLLERRKLPDAVVVLENVRPRREDEEEEEEEAEPEDDEAEEEGEPELDEEGNPIPRKPKTPKPFDQDDEKMYRKLLAHLLEQFAISPEDDDGAPPATDDDGTPAAAPLPRQAFGVRTVNVFGMSAEDVVATIVRQVRPVVERAVVPQDGEELLQDDEDAAADDDEGEEGADAPKPNPLLLPGRKAIHQYGLTLKYCPVTLHETGVLVAGDPANWLSYRGGRYVFVTPEAMERFRLNPDRFMPTIPPTIPAPRLWLMGVVTSGKRTLAASLTERFGVQPFWLEPAFLVDVMAAAMNPEGGVAGGVAIPHTPAGSNAHLDAALAIAAGLRQREQAESDQLAAKEKALADQAAKEEARENGEDVDEDELDEAEEEALQKIIEFEPEDEEAKAERVAKEQRRMAAALMRVEPFESRGYVLIGGAPTELDAEQLLEFNAFPEAVVSLKLSPETFVARGCDAEFAKRVAEFDAQVAEVAAKRRSILRKQRAVEIAKWRRRNIGGGDDDDVEEEELPEDPEAPAMDAVRGDLEGQHDTDTGAVQAVLGLLPDRRVPVIEVNADWGKETVLRTTVGALSANLEHRRSMLENPLVVTYDQAIELIATGRKHFSSLRFADPVRLRRERAGAPPEVQLRPSGRGVEPEAEVPEPEPEPPKPKKMKTITRENDEGEEEEVEVTDDEADDEDANDADAADEDEEPEPEPELSPEEMEEMQAEHDAKVKKLADRKKQRACVLRNRVYFFQSDATLLAFLTEGALDYWDQPPPPPYAPSVVAVVDEEAPTSAATSATRPRAMAHHIAHNMGAVFLDAPKVLKWAASCPKLPTLRQESLTAILKGDAVPDELLTTALACRLLCADVCAKGAVLSNLPRTDRQFDALLANGVALHKVLVLPPSSGAPHRAKWQAPAIVATVDQVARVSSVIQSARFSNAAIVETYEAARRNLRNRQALAVSRKLAFPARIHDASQPEQFLRDSRSVFQTYCPWTWVREGRLVDSFGATELAVEHCGQQFYFSAEEHVAFFMREPHALSGERGDVRPLPTVLPAVLPRNEALSVRATDLEHAGCCPVTLYETRDNKGLKGVTEPKAVLGSANHVVAYAGKKYALADDEAVTKFLRQPWVFVDGAVLPLAHRMPFDKEDAKSQSTELYIKRMVYEQTARAMLAVAETRPKFPGLSPLESALKYVGLHLKAHNDENTQHRQRCYEESFSAFTERATLYKAIGLQAPEDEAELADFRQRCAVWDEVQDQPDCWRAYQHPSALTSRPEPEE